MKRTLAFALAIGASLVAAPAEAHFILQAPACWMSQDGSGVPEKLGPCGNEGGGTPSGIVTAYQVGDTITITIDEVVFHPGHYRVSLGVNGQSDLPVEPAVTAGSTPCGTAVIQSPAVFPVLADDLLDHTEPFSAPQTVTVKLPAGVTCDNCTLQVIEFMSDHGLNVPGGCFYHHCADISIGSPVQGGDGGPASDGGSLASSSSSASGASSTSGASSGTATSSGGGGGASSASSSTSGAGGAGGASPGSSSSGSGAGVGVSSSGGVVNSSASASSVSSSSGIPASSLAGSGCGCSVPEGDANVAARLAAVLAAGLFLARRRR